MRLLVARVDGVVFEVLVLGDLGVGDIQKTAAAMGGKGCLGGEDKSREKDDVLRRIKMLPVKTRVIQVIFVCRLWHEGCASLFEWLKASIQEKRHTCQSVLLASSQL